MSRNTSYWEKRSEEIEAQLHKKSEEYYKEAEKQFKQAEKQIAEDIEKWYARLADNNEISLAEVRKFLDADELEEFKWTVEEYIKHGKENGVSKDWSKELENASAKYHIRRLESIQTQIRQHIEILYARLSSGLEKQLSEVYEEAYYRRIFNIQQGFEIGSTVTKLDNRRIQKVLEHCWAMDGKTFSDRIWQNKTTLVNELNTILTQSIIRGENTGDYILTLSKKMKTSRANASRLIYTESAAIAAKADKDCYKDLGVEEFEFLATMDSHTSEICREMDGKHFKMSEYQIGVNAPPLHPWCRSTTVPYFNDEFTAMEQRAARGEDGKTYYVPGDMTYEEWKESFVDGEDKSGLQEIKAMEKSDKVGNTVRTKEEFEQVANNVKTDITNYSSNLSKWSGTIHTKRSLIDGEAIGLKEWSCDISIMDVADDGVIWHEILHSCSASYYDPVVYATHEYIEEATVEFLKQQICIEKNIPSVTAYEDRVIILQTLNNTFGYGTDLEFAKELFNIPLPDRYQWLEDKVDASLRVANVSFQDYNDVMQFLQKLKGGKYGTIK